MTFAEQQIMKATGCSLEESRDIERLMGELKDGRGRSVTDMPALRFEALAREAACGLFLLSEMEAKL